MSDLTREQIEDWWDRAFGSSCIGAYGIDKADFLRALQAPAIPAGWLPIESAPEGWLYGPGQFLKIPKIPVWSTQLNGVMKWRKKKSKTAKASAGGIHGTVTFLAVLMPLPTGNPSPHRQKRTRSHE